MRKVKCSRILRKGILFPSHKTTAKLYLISRRLVISLILNHGFFLFAVHHNERLSCRSKEYISLPARGGYLSSYISEETGCGLGDTPYRLQLLPGQRVNITLMDFSIADRQKQIHTDSHGSSPLKCDSYGSVTEPHSGRVIDICGGHRREETVFLSESNFVEISFKRKIKSNGGHFILRYNSKYI